MWALLFRRGRTLAGPQMYAARPGGRALQPSTSYHLLNRARRRYEIAVAIIFANPGPSGPEETAESHSDFARRKFSTDLQVRVPRNGGPGVSRHWRTKFASAASPGDPLGTFPSGKVPRPAGRNPVKLPAARRGRGPGQPLLPLRGNSPSRALRRRQNLRGGGGKPPPYRMRLVKAEQISAPHPPPSGTPDPIPSGLRPSPLDKGSRPPGGRLNESGRRNTPLRINDHTNIRFKYFPV